MMKVLEINVDDVGLGGVYALVTSVIRHAPRGLKLDLAGIAQFENPDNVRALNALGTDVYYIGTEGGLLSRPAAYYRNTLRLLQSGGYDCAHIHGDLAYLLLIFAKAARRAGVKKIILHSHAAGIDGRLRRVKGALHALTRRALKRCATVFVACSDKAARWMYPNLDAESVVRINNGVDLNRFAFAPKTRERLRGELGLTDAFVVGHVGRFAWQKNHEYLLRAFAAIRGRVPNARLLLVGEGPLFDATRAMAGELGLLDGVIFYVASYDVGALMQAMDLFLLPSRFEGLPVVGVEAQAAGLPVIFSDAVTRQAKLTDGAWFLPTDAGSTDRWARQAQAVAGAQTDRRQGLEAVKRAGFAIQDTVEAFLALYGISGAGPDKGGDGA